MEGRREHVADVMVRAAALTAALDAGSAYLDPADTAAAQATVEHALKRLELGGDHTVIALVGATGSGKSSLFNALASMDIAQVGARRPLTTLPMACIWGEGGSQELLEWLEVPQERRFTRESILDADRQAPLHGLVLLDLPDHDSTEVVHRVEVDRLVTQVDLLVWVVDPQKYADDALHSGYLQKLTGHDGVMVVVLNQVDRLEPDDLETCRRDLRRLLDGDGLESVRMLPVSTRRGDGINDLRELLASVVQDRTAIARRLGADLDAATGSVARGLAVTEPGDGNPPGVDRLVEELAMATGVPAVVDALAAEYRRRGWLRTGWPVLRLLRKLAPDALGRLGGTVGEEDLRVIATSLMPVSAPSQRPRVELAVDTAVSRSADPLPRLWADAVRAAVATPPADASGRETDLVTALDEAVATVDLEVSPPPWWQLARIAQILLALALVAGLGWLVVVSVGQVIGRGLDHPPALLGVPVPVVLVVVGLLGGALLAALSAWLLRAGARRRRSTAQERLHRAVEEVAEQRVVAPIRPVLALHRTTRLALAGEPAATPATAAVEPERPTAAEAPPSDAVTAQPPAPASPGSDEARSLTV